MDLNKRTTVTKTIAMANYPTCNRIILKLVFDKLPHFTLCPSFIWSQKKHIYVSTVFLFGKMFITFNFLLFLFPHFVLRAHSFRDHTLFYFIFLTHCKIKDCTESEVPRATWKIKSVFCFICNPTYHHIR